MGGINAQIPLEGRPPQFENPLDAAARGLQLKQMMQASAQQQALAPGQLQQQQNTLQAEAQENQMRQMQIDDQQKYAKAWLDAGGDLDKTQQLAVQYGVRPQTLIANQQMLTQHKEAIAKLTAAQLANLKTKNDMYSGLLQPVLAEPDPVKQEAIWNQQMQVGLQRGILTPDDVRPFPGPDGARQLNAGLMTLEQLRAQTTAEAAMKRSDAMAANAKLNMDKWNIEKSGAEAKANAQLLTDTTQILGAKQLDPADYAVRLEDLTKKNPDVAGTLPTADQYAADPVQAVKDINRIGQTAQQRVQSDEAAKRDANAQKDREDMLSIRMDMRDIAQQRADQANKADQTDRKDAYRVYYKSQAAESSLNQLRMSLGNAIASGNQYVDRMGNVRPATPADFPGLKTQMEDRYQQITNDLKTAVANRYDAAGKLGKDVDSYPIEKYYQDLDAGDEKVFGPKTTTATPPAPVKKAPTDAGANAVQPGQPATPPAPATKPATSAAPAKTGNAPQPMTEAEARQKAVAANKDPDWYVDQLRQRKLIK